MSDSPRRRSVYEPPNSRIVGDSEVGQADRKERIPGEKSRSHKLRRFRVTHAAQGSSEGDKNRKTQALHFGVSANQTSENSDTICPESAKQDTTSRLAQRPALGGLRSR